MYSGTFGVFSYFFSLVLRLLNSLKNKVEGTHREGKKEEVPNG